MESNEPKYTSFIGYVVLWGMYICITIRFPFLSKFYFWVGIIYFITTHNLYFKKTCKYLIELYPEECRRAIKSRHLPDTTFSVPNYEVYMTLITFNQGYRKEIFDHSDKILSAIYLNNMIKAVFSYFMFFTLSASFLLNFFCN